MSPRPRYHPQFALIGSRTRAILQSCLVILGTIGVALPAWSGPATSEEAARGTFAEDAFVKSLVELASESCLERGDDPAALAKLAGERNWTLASDEELARHNNQFTRMVGGWHFSGRFSSYAILQSVNDSPPTVHVCSITTKLRDGRDLESFKTSFERRYSVLPDEILEKADGPSYRYWIARDQKNAVRVSLVSTLKGSMLTIRMIHGPRSQPAS